MINVAQRAKRAQRRTDRGARHPGCLRDRAAAGILSVIEAHKSHPRRARQTGTEGIVRLAVAVGADGTVTGVSLETPHSSVLLNRAALKTAEPLVGRQTGLKHTVTLTVPVRFSLSASLCADCRSVFQKGRTEYRQCRARDRQGLWRRKDSQHESAAFRRPKAARAPEGASTAFFISACPN